VIVASRILNVKRDRNDVEKPPRGIVALSREIIPDRKFEPIASRRELPGRQQRRIEAAVMVGCGGMGQFAVAVKRNFHPGGGKAARNIQNVGRELWRHHFNHARVTTPVIIPNGSSNGTNISLSFLIPNGSRLNGIRCWLGIFKSMD